MGRNTTTPSPASLDRFSIGEIQDISGVPNFYDAGTSKWLRSATFVAGSNLSTTTKSILASSATSAGAATVALGTTNDLFLVSNYPVVREQWQVARISSISTTVIPMSVANSSINVMVINSSGATPINVALSSYVTGGASSPFSLVSDNTKFYVYYYTSASAMACKSSTDGITWTTETLTSFPTIGGLNSGVGFWDWDNANYAQPNAGFYYGTTSVTSYGVSGVFWCGARFLAISRNTSGNFVASLSTNGTTWGGDNTSAVLGNTTQGFAVAVNFYRNGNNCFIFIGSSIYRKSSDGGVTWSNVSTGPAANSFGAGIQYNIPNQTDPARRLIFEGEGGTAAYYTSDSGATWSSSRTLPIAYRNSVVYRGSTVCLSDSSTRCYRSTDDGATWSTIVFPVGTNANYGEILADAYRFYFIPQGQTQILTSTDAITWTIVSTPGAMSASSYTNLMTLNSNVSYISIGGLGQGIFTLDGGITWSFAKTSTDANVSNNIAGYIGQATTDGPSGGYLIQFCGGAGSNNSYNFLLSGAALTAGGGFYRTGSSVITPVRANSLSYIRVG